ncbi:diguanylate cyclase [Sulfurimonas sp. HSL-1716]|uniref:diguanylate cyclase domain-containing protein n=1 Tax=Hydrocurvibacter sulfurireducens TaxID=3131937 RepID=UPI0031F9C422
MKKYSENNGSYKKLLKAPYQLIIIMVIVVIIVTNTSIYGLYKIGFEQQRKRLTEIVQSEAVMIDAIINYQLKMDNIDALSDKISKAQSEAIVLKKLMYAHEKFVGFGDTGEYTLAKLDKNTIHFLLSHRHNEVDRMDSITIDSKLAAPMREALHGKRGSLVGLDYRGSTVLAAYEPIKSLGWGIVAKIDLSEIQAPYIQAAEYGFFGSIILIIIGSVIVLFFTHPLIKEIEESRQYNRMLFTKSPMGLVLTDMKGNMLDVNPAFLNLTGYTLEEVLNMTYWEITPKKYASQEHEQLSKLLNEGNYGPYEKEYIHKNGHLVNVRLSGCRLQRDGKSFIWSSVEDITEKKRYEIALKEASLVFEHTHEGIVITDADVNIIRVNSTFTKITGYTFEEVAGKNPNFLQSGKHDDDFYKKMWDTINAKGTWYGEINNRRKSGESFTTLQSITAVKNEDGSISGYVSVFSDISERKNNELKLAHLASHDTLTSLPNRMHFNDNLEQAIKMAKRRKNKIGILFIDLNRFKEVNDTLGHEIGDHLLKEVAKRLLECVREDDTVSRLGGDEFAVILTEIKESQDSLNIVKKIMHGVERPVYIYEHFLAPSLSIGISIYPEDGEERSVLLNNADKAMYMAKQKREERYEFYKKDL